MDSEIQSSGGAQEAGRSSLHEVFGGVSWGQHVRWTEPDGTVKTIQVTKCATSKEAQREAITAAKRAGWTPPKWWQWWRWNDTRIKPPNDTLCRPAGDAGGAQKELSK